MTSANDRAVLNAIFNPLFGPADDDEPAETPGVYAVFFGPSSLFTAVDP